MYRLLLLFFLPFCVQAQSIEDKLKDHQEYSRDELVYIHTSQSFYQPGEYIYGTVWVFHPDNKTPSEFSKIIKLEVLDPSSKVISELSVSLFKGCGAFSYNLPYKSGMYTIKVCSVTGANFMGKSSVSKYIQVQGINTSNVLIYAQTEKTIFKYGDSVDLNFKVDMANNKGTKINTIEYTLILDGVNEFSNQIRTDSSGKASVKFKLPVNKVYHSALVYMNVNVDGISASELKVLQLPGSGIAVEMFPEGGHLKYGVKSKVAYKVYDKNRRPKMINGFLVDDECGVINQISTIHEGMGLFELTPETGHQYSLILADESGLTDTFRIGSIDTNAVVLSVEQLGGNSLKIRVEGTSGNDMKLCLRAGDKFLKQYEFDLKDSQIFTYSGNDIQMGIVQMNLFDSIWQPLAERLVFMNSEKRLNISYRFDRSIYYSKDTVALTLEIKDQTGHPVSAMASMTVYSEDLYKESDPFAANGLSELYLSQELRNDVEHPAYYFKNNKRETLANLDLLMMCSKSVRIPYWAMDSMDAILKRKMLIEQGYVVRGCIFIKEIFKDMDFYCKMTDLICENNGQLIYFDSLGNFTLLGIPNNGELRFRVRSPGQHGYSFKATPWLVNEDLRVQSNVNWYFSMERDSLVFKDRKWDPSVLKKGKSGIKYLIDYRTSDVNENNPAINMDIVPQRYMAGRGSRSNGTATYIDGVRVMSVTCSTGYSSDFYSSGTVFSSSACLSQSRRYKYWRENTEPVSKKVLIVSERYLTDYYYMSLENPRYFETHYYNPFKFYANYNNRFVNVDTSRFVFSYPGWQGYYYNYSDQNKSNIICYVHHIFTDKNGKATIKFKTMNSTGVYRCSLFACGNGMIGEEDTTFSVTGDLLFEIKMPDKLWKGDKLFTDLKLNNTSDYSQVIRVNCKIGDQNRQYSVKLEPKSTSVVPIRLENMLEGYNNYSLELNNGGNIYNQSGFIHVAAPSEYMSYVFNGSHLHRKDSFYIPESRDLNYGIRSSFSMSTKISDLMEKMTIGMLREPHGCFEQVSSSNYPNILAYRYFLQHPENITDYEMSTYKLYIESGYKKLVAYETSASGFEWYGGLPPHEGLTAYGIMQFLEMKELGFNVDSNMLNRVSKWLYKRFKNDGSINQSFGRYDQFSGQDNTVVTAYAAYALSHFKTFDLSKTISYLDKKMNSDLDPYVAVLLSEIYKLKGDTLNSGIWTDKLAAHYNSNKAGLDCRSTLTRSSGSSKKIELYGIIAWHLLKEKKYDDISSDLIRRIIEMRSAGGVYSSTQSTIWALKALTEWLKDCSYQTNKETLVMKINDKTMVIDLKNVDDKDLNPALKVGWNTIETNSLYNLHTLYQFSVKWMMKDVEKKSEQLHVEMKLNKDTVLIGGPVMMKVKVDNLYAGSLEQVVAVIQMPSGCRPLAEQLRLMKVRGDIDYYEIVDGQLYLYFREFKEKESKIIFIPFLAEISGSLIQPAVIVYPYYYKEMKAVSNSDLIEVISKN